MSQSVEPEMKNLPPEVEPVAEPVQRRRAGTFQWTVLAALLAFSGLAFLSSQVEHFAVDLALARGLQSFRPAWFAALMQFVSFFGYLPQSVVFVVAAGLALYGLGWRWEALVAVAGGTLAGLLSSLVKYVIARPRPADELVEVLRALGGFSFPSGHVLFYSGFFGFLGFLSFTRLRRSWLRAALLGAFGGLVLLVGPSRVYLGAHWPSDVLGGYLLGGLALLGIITIYRWGHERFFDLQGE